MHELVSKISSIFTLDIKFLEHVFISDDVTMLMYLFGGLCTFVMANLDGNFYGFIIMLHMLLSLIMFVLFFLQLLLFQLYLYFLSFHFYSNEMKTIVAIDFQLRYFKVMKIEVARDYFDKGYKYSFTYFTLNSFHSATLLISSWRIEELNVKFLVS